ncbi:unnamed protein product [Rotaria sordida]|uniref:Uncharacterized protein n=2 Tax=Rotaria sordida TaxID=392033 RepID=A0A814BUY4_9BILA|nr:unnamed protein product [Rotaria sordida]CAF0933100.1 unnamed protein product [Rotaria sordida]
MPYSVEIVILYCIPSLISISISPCAIWNTTGITIAGTGISGASPQQLSYPQGIFIHDRKKRLYVSDTFNNRIQLFPLDQSTTTGITLLSRLSHGYKIYVDDDNDDFPTIYIAMNGANRVEKWIQGATHGIQIGDQCRGCTGVWLDKEKNIYMSEHDRHRILKWSPKTNMTTMVAGETDKKGPRSDHLNEPQGIFIDTTTEALYIADLINHRIQKWLKDGKEGVTVAGSSDGDPGSDAKSLDRPYGLRVDEETKTVYVVDLLNNRIQRWRNGAIEGETIAGGNGQGNESNQFFHPTDLAFDNQGNLYVSEGWNHRVQFFALINNRPCYESSTSTVYSSTSTMLILTWIIMTFI